MEERTLLEDGARASSIFRGFVYMSVMFSLNHGTVTAVLALASAEFGARLGGASAGTLYVVYTSSALLAAPAAVARLGAKRALVAGLSLYCCYVASFLVALEAVAVRAPAAIVGAAIGGVGGGLIWTAQGVYFARAALSYARASATAPEAANATLSGVFATLYLGLEVAMKLLSSLARKSAV